MSSSDVAFVLVCEQVLDDCETHAELQAVAKRLTKERLSEVDRQYLRKVYKECWRAVSIVQRRPLH